MSDFQKNPVEQDRSRRGANTKSIDGKNWFVDALRSEFTKLLLAAIFGAGGTLTIIYNTSSAYINDKIAKKIESIVNNDITQGERSVILTEFKNFLKKEMDSDKSELNKIVSDRLSTYISDITGPVTFGMVYLSSEKNSGELDIFCPPGHDVRLLFRVEGLAEGQHIIELQYPTTKAYPIKENGPVKAIKLSKLLKDPSITEEEPAEGTRDLGHFKYMYHFTITLKPLSKATTLRTERKVELYYISLLSPVLKAQELQTAAERIR